MQYLFQHQIPIPWLLADTVTLLLTLWVVIFIVRKSQHPAIHLLEGFCFVFLYAGIFENFAVVLGWYIYGRSLLMLGDVPLSVPLIEMDVLLLGLWMLDKMQVPNWTKPFVVGLLGMLQDFSLDPVATKQVFTSAVGITGRWTWLPGRRPIFPAGNTGAAPICRVATKARQAPPAAARSFRPGTPDRSTMPRTARPVRQPAFHAGGAEGTGFQVLIVRFDCRPGPGDDLL